MRSAEQLVYLENQFLWSPEVVNVLVEKLATPPSDDFRVVVLLPARANDGADISRGQVAALIDADDGNERFLACTVYAREGPLRDIVYVHAKVGIVDDRWLTVGSANLNAHSLLHDTEMNVVTHDETLARATRMRLWAEHLERDEKDVAGEPAAGRRRLWWPTATEQLHRIERGEPLTHRLVRLPGVSRRRRRVFGSLAEPPLRHLTCRGSPGCRGSVLGNARSRARRARRSGGSGRRRRSRRPRTTPSRTRRRR